MLNICDLRVDVYLSCNKNKLKDMKTETQRGTIAGIRHE
jgi:hypothetical protein